MGGTRPQGTVLIGIDRSLAVGLIRLMTLPLPREDRIEARDGIGEAATVQGNPEGANVFFYLVAVAWSLAGGLGVLLVIAVGALVDSAIGRAPPGGGELITFFAVTGMLGAAGAGVGLARYRIREGRDSQVAAVDVALGGAWNALQLGVAAIAAIYT